MTHALVIAQHHDNALDASIYPTIHAAGLMADTVDVLLAAPDDVLASEIAAIEGVAKVLVATADHFSVLLAEEVSPLVIALASDYTHIVMAANTTGKDILPRIAVGLDNQQVSDIIEVIDANTFKRPIYAGNAIETVSSNQSQHVISIRPSAFDKAPTGQNDAALSMIDAPAPVNITQFESMEGSGGDRPDLASASRVVSGGRGVGSAEQFALIEALADKLGAAVGASRAAVDAGYVANDYQVGQTGKIVAPELYIAVGISGAIQHLAGMKASKTIVAINKDESAPIFDIADYGLVADLFDAVPELTEKL